MSRRRAAPSASNAMTTLDRAASAPRSAPFIRKFGLAPRNKSVKRRVDRRVERRRLIFGEHPPATLHRALANVLHARVAPLLERTVVGDGALPEGGPIARERVRGPEEMLAWPYLAERVERQRLVVHREALHPDVQRGAEIDVHHEFFVAHDEGALEPARELPDDERAERRLRRPECRRARA